MADTFQLSVLTPQKRVWQGVVQTVTAPGDRGDFGVLPGHVAYITAVRPGALVIDDGKTRQVWAVGEGFAQVAAERVSIVVSSCEPAAGLDGDAVREALAQAEHALLDTAPSDPTYMDAALDQAMALGRLRAIGELGSSSAQH